MVADNLTEQTAAPTLLHEVGIHMANDGSLDGVFKRAKFLVDKAKGAFYDRVRARMRDAGETSAEEAAAYLAEEFERHRVGAPVNVSNFVRDFIAKVRAWLHSKGVLISDDMLTPADIAAIARANLKQLAESGQTKMGEAGVKRSNSSFESPTHGYLDGKPYSPKEEVLTESEKDLIISTFNKSADIPAQTTDEVERSDDIYSKSKAFQDLAKADGWSVSERADGKKYFVISKGDVDLNVRVSDHARVNQSHHFKETDINLSVDDSGWAFDTFESALWKMRNAAVDEYYAVTIGGEEPVRFSSSEKAQRLAPNGQFDAANDDIRFSRAQTKELRNLVTIHNLTAENLMKADALGGLPVPSLGITKADSAYSGYGEVTLIAPKDMADPATGTPVFDRDAYTARFPEMHYQKPKRKAADAFMQKLEGLLGDVDGAKEFAAQVFKTVYDSSNPTPTKVGELFQQFDAPRLIYARDVLGKNIKVPMEPVPLNYAFSGDQQLQSFMRKNQVALAAGDANISAQLAEEVAGAIDRMDLSDKREALANKIRQDLHEVLLGDHGTLDRRSINYLLEDLKNAKAKRVNSYELNARLDKAFDRYGASYGSWINEQMQGLFEAPTITLRGKQVEPTLDNLVQAMTSVDVASKEKTMVTGAGKVAAAMGKQFTSLDDVKAARSQLMGAEEFGAAHKTNESILDGYREKAVEHFTGTNYRGDIDYFAGYNAAMEALAIAGKKARATDADIRTALERKGFNGVDQSVVDLARQSIAALRKAPAKYFEAKPQRAVGLNEFRGAVVPKGIDPQVRATLDKHGIEVVEHGKAVGAREQAIEKLAKKLDKAEKDILFSKKASQKPLGEAELRNLYNETLQGMENAPPLVVVEKASDLPFDAPDDAQGVAFGGKVFLVAGNISNASDARDVVRHEVLGHYGLRGFFGKGLGAVLRSIHGSNVSVQKAAYKWKRENQDVITQWKADYGVTDSWVQERAIEEALAGMAERGDLERVRNWHGLVVKLQDMLRAIGLNSVANWLENKTDAQALMALKSGEAFVRSGEKAQTDNAPPAFSRSQQTQQKYEARIDELFDGDAARRGGVRVLDRSDVLELIGYGSKPMDLLETKVLKAQDDHPNMKAEHWKKIPEWLDNPAAVFDSDTVPGRLVFVAPELVAGAPVLMAVSPDAQNTGTLKVSLLVSAYDTQGGRKPFGRWMREGLMRYANTKEFPAVLKQSVGLQLPESAFKNKPGMPKILTEKNLNGYGKQQESNSPRFSSSTPTHGWLDGGRITHKQKRLQLMKNSLDLAILVDSRSA